MKFKVVIPYLIFFFVIASWPFIYYPFTDGDINHWLPLAKEIQINLNFLSSTVVDQSHGPLLAWGSGVISKIAPTSFYGFALFNILIAVLGVFLIYFFSMKLWNKEKIAVLATFILSTSLAYVYMARTPMYDLCAAIFYFAFCGFYLLYVLNKKTSYLLLALGAVALGSLSRFSIVLGLSGIYLIAVNLIYRRPILLMIFDGIIVGIASCLSNVPWLLSQQTQHGGDFINTFFKDNVYRFIKEPGEGAHAYRDFFTFPLYVFIGFLPHSFSMFMTFFQKDFWPRLKENKTYQALVASFLPCLLLFSLSGHVKLGRYIFYVFPIMALLVAHSMHEFDLNKQRWRNRTGMAAMVTIVLLSILFFIIILNFLSETEESVLLVVGVIVMLLSQIYFMYFAIRYKSELLLESPKKLLIPLGLAYIFCFSIISYESFNVKFLVNIRESATMIVH